MRNGYKILSYCADDNMSNLIGDNYEMLLVLGRFGIDMGFGDKSIAQVCEKHDIDTQTFLSVVNLLIANDKKRVDSSELSLGSLIDYLSRSHVYFLEYRLPTIRQKLQSVISDNDALVVAIINYYDEYVAEVQNHMKYEEDVVFKYVDDLMSDRSNGEFSISMFSDHHEGMNSKLSELKNIIIKYYPIAMTNELSSVLFEIFACERDLCSHGDVEDYLLIPAIRRVEKQKI